LRGSDPEKLQGLKTLRNRDYFSIGDCVGGPRQQIGQADLWTNRAWQCPQGQVKGTGNLLQQKGERFCESLSHRILK
jgi:hypothetical protein